LKSYHVLEIELETGRHHQIRAQLAAEGIHIKGDLKYGAKRPNSDGSIHLHARSLQFVHPITKEEMKFIASYPNDMIWNVLRD
jgi:23S rRNA pseudouridine1911/1915/1917 synthase